MIMAAARNGWLNGDKTMMESLIALKRAGCDGLTYFAPRATEALRRPTTSFPSN
jgi:porphobilinogen synthase